MSEESRKERRVLVAVDESDESMYALSWSLKNIIFQNSSDTLILLYVKPHHHDAYATFDSTGIMDDPQTPGHVLSPEASAAIKKYSQDVVDCVLQKSKRMCKDLENVKVETQIESGNPKDVICEMSRKLNADLLVMGSHDYAAMKRAFFDSVSEYCSQNVKCPVLIVRKRKPYAGSGN
ncbi:hypothetical protein LR48_Vigan03g265400 [Vigna angularis]|uniref:UspA domain-containing protein n=2 Tax=Phaseolus angularis TaxID=3914 RepID=A0A0L9U9L5_PHAAN|nr:universal stress protein A-like protein [Vigna angularis]KOM39272.1 hypothetical protein LR48_Vigan03g265400 [Vigna angularis]BAT86116.1 hypothetical protein VIGAN_04373700 [Vigna angularis var. angularis]